MAKLTIMEALEQSLVRVKQYTDEAVENATPEIITEEDVNAIIADIDN